MQTNYRVADLQVGGNVIVVTATAADNGGLTIHDLSYGRAADLFYGEGRDVEVWLELGPDSVATLATHFFGAAVENPADEVSKLLASLYQDDSRALSKIQQMLDELQIKYKKEMWT